MVAQSYPPIVGGEERMVQQLSRGLSERGHEVSVATLRQPWHESAVAHDGDVRVARIQSSTGRSPLFYRGDARRFAPPLPDPGAARAIESLIAQVQPDVIHAHNWLGYSMLRPGRRSSAAVVMSLHDYGLVCATKRLMRNGSDCAGPGWLRCPPCASRQYGALKAPLVSAAVRASAHMARRSVDMFIAISDVVARRSGLEEAGLLYEVIPNFVEDDLDSRPLPADTSPLRKLPDGEFLLFVGDVRRDKGAETLLCAHAALERPLPLVLLGRPDPDVPIPAGQGVIQLGPWPHDLVLEAWRRCAVALAPSLWEEPFGLVVLEAMAMGRPVIASRAGGIPDFLADGRDGVLVPPGDVAALRSAIDEMTASPARRRAFGQAARARAREFSSTAVVPRLEDVYARLVRRGAGRTVRVDGGPREVVRP